MILMFSFSDLSVLYMFKVHINNQNQFKMLIKTFYTWIMICKGSESMSKLHRYLCLEELKNLSKTFGIPIHNLFTGRPALYTQYYTYTTMTEKDAMHRILNLYIFAQDAMQEKQIILESNAKTTMQQILPIKYLCIAYYAKKLCIEYYAQNYMHRIICIYITRYRILFIITMQRIICIEYFTQNTICFGEFF